MDTIEQDIGRVLLNLFNRAFYAVNEHVSSSSAGQSYEPIVSVITKKSENNVIITVSDNGNGITQKFLIKSSSLFFTIKPTGQRTGLGFSLSYDIVKAHGGEIRVESMEVEGC
ncbi:MAG: ATP-binding protein [Ginsengibacter sp.]